MATMKNRAQAYILQSSSGQWTVEVWIDDVLVQCVSGLQTEADAVKEASSLAQEFEGLKFVITQAIERPSL